MTSEERRIGFTLPPEVFEQLLDEVMYEEKTDQEEGFWERLRSYYALSTLQGDSVICHPSFVQVVAEHDGTDPPAWVHEQTSLKKMQCLVIAGPTRGAVLLEILKAIAAMRASDEEGDD